MTIFSKNFLGSIAPLPPPSYVYDRYFCLPIWKHENAVVTFAYLDLKIRNQYECVRASLIKLDLLDDRKLARCIKAKFHTYVKVLKGCVHTARNTLWTVLNVPGSVVSVFRFGIGKLSEILFNSFISLLKFGARSVSYLWRIWFLLNKWKECKLSCKSVVVPIEKRLLIFSLNVTDRFGHEFIRQQLQKCPVSKHSDTGKRRRSLFAHFKPVLSNQRPSWRFCCCVCTILMTTSPYFDNTAFLTFLMQCSSIPLCHVSIAYKKDFHLSTEV